MSKDNELKETIEQITFNGSSPTTELIYDRPHHWYCNNCKTMFGRSAYFYKYCYNCGKKLIKDSNFMKEF